MLFQQHAVEPWVVCVHVVDGAEPAVIKSFVTKGGADDGGTVLCKECRDLLSGDYPEGVEVNFQLMCKSCVVARWPIENAS